VLIGRAKRRSKKKKRASDQEKKKSVTNTPEVSAEKHGGAGPVHRCGKKNGGALEYIARGGGERKKTVTKNGRKHKGKGKERG